MPAVRPHTVDGGQGWHMIDRSDELREMYADETNDPLAHMFNGAWLDTQVFPPLEYAVPGIIPEGFGLLVSPPKAGKSWLVCGIGLACAIGGLALGRIHVHQRPVLYLALEDGHRRLQSRSRHIMCGEPLPAGIHFITKAKPAQVIPIISEFLQRHSDDKPLIILDTLGKARPPALPAPTCMHGITRSAANLKTPSTPHPARVCSPCITPENRSHQTSLTRCRAVKASPAQPTSY